MAQFNMNDIEHYSSSGTGSFFTLKDDMDKAKVRFLYRDINDISGYAVHRVAVGDKERYVNCLRDYRDPVDKCPFCAAQIKLQARLFLQLYNEDAQEVQIWERGKNFYGTIAGLSARYNPLHDEIIEIERHGKKGDTGTTYQPYPVEKVPVNLEDFDTVDPIGTIILDKSADDMNEYLNTGSFPDSGSSSSSEQRRDSYDRPEPRRTPTSSGPRRSF